MVSVQEALNIVKECKRDFGSEIIPFERSMGRILDEDLFADRDFPAFDRIMMDGIAISYDSYHNGQRAFTIESISPAGIARNKLHDPQKCIEVMTGAIRPDGTDTVIRYEDLDIQKANARIKSNVSVKQNQNIHQKGKDQKQNDLLISSGTEIKSAGIAILASIGKSQVRVKSLPKILIVSTGDELVKIDQSPLEHQIRRSNVHQIQSVLNSWGLRSDTKHLNDDIAEIRFSMAEIIDAYDAIILSGAVSKGKFDHLPQVLSEFNVEKLFHKVHQRPGKPFWFGKTNTCTVFAFPGNPISSFLCLQRYFRDWLSSCNVLADRKKEFATLSEDIGFKPDLCYFAAVKVRSDVSGNTVADLVKINGSGDLVSLDLADAFIQLPRGRERFIAGESFEFLRFE